MTDPSHSMIIDRALLRQRLARAAMSQPVQHPLLTRVSDDILERLSVVLRDFKTAAVISPVATDLPGRLAREANVRTIVDARTGVVKLGDATVSAMIDDEALPLKPGSFDLIVSLLALQTTNDMPGALLQARRALQADGLFIGVLCGGQTLHELRSAFLEAEAACEDGVSPRVLPFAGVRDLGGLMQRAGFALPVADTDTVTVTYPTPWHLMQELRGHGATNVLAQRTRKMTRRATLAHAVEIYGEKFSEPNGRVQATVELVTVTGWAPDASQQQPLKPGAATVRLADALGPMANAPEPGDNSGN